MDQTTRVQSGGLSAANTAFAAKVYFLLLEDKEINH
jgi:hypothetical protein